MWKEIAIAGGAVLVGIGGGWFLKQAHGNKAAQDLVKKLNQSVERERQKDAVISRKNAQIRELADTVENRRATVIRRRVRLSKGNTTQANPESVASAPSATA